MHTKRTIFIIITIVFIPLLFFRCTKKEKEEVTVIQPEAVEIEVDVPQVHWEKSIGVLPVKSESMSLVKNSLADLVSSRLYSDLSKIQGLKVYSPVTSELVDQSILQADYLLKTDITEEEEEQMSIQVQLIDAKKEVNRPAKIYGETFHSLFAVEEGAAKTVAEKLGYTMGTGESISLETTSPEVRKLYLEAQGFQVQGKRESVNQAVEKYKEALRIDSTFTQAWIGLAESYLQIVYSGWDRNVVWPKLAHEASLKAVHYDSTQAEAYLMLGQVYLAWGDFKQAEQTYKKALKINNNLDQAWIGLGQIYSQFGLYEASLKVFDKALSLKPDDAGVSLNYAMILVGLRQYKESEKVFRRILTIHPEEQYFHSFLALTQFYQDNISNAASEIQLGLKSEVYRPFSHAVLGMIYTKQGKLDEALSEVELEVKPYVGNNGSLASAVAAIYALLKRDGQAVQWLEKAIQFGYREYPWVMNDPNFKDLHNDGRFIQLMEKVKENWKKNMELYNREGSA